MTGGAAHRPGQRRAFVATFVLNGITVRATVASGAEICGNEHTHAQTQQIHMIPSAEVQLLHAKAFKRSLCVSPVPEEQSRKTREREKGGQKRRKRAAKGKRVCRNNKEEKKRET